MKQTSITQEMIEEAKNFTKKYSENYYNKNNRRSSDEIEYNVYIGYLGELCFQKICEENNISIKRPQSNNENNFDNGYDFIDDNYIKIDIKTLDGTWKKRLYINDRYKKPDKYGLIIVDKVENIAQFLGYITTNELENKKILDIKHDCFYIEKESFNE